jgi:predicted nuclease with TOPRIM domain
MPTNKELELEVQQLKERLAHLQTSNSRMLDDIATLKSHYGNLVEGLNVRFESLQTNFLNRK